MFSFVWRSHLNLFSQLIMLFIKSKKPKILTMQNQHHYIPLVQTCLNVSFFSCRVPLEVLVHQASLEILALLWVSINLRLSSSVTTCIAILCTVVKLKPKKKFGVKSDSNPWPLRYRYSALSNNLRSGILFFHGEKVPCRREKERTPDRRLSIQLWVGYIEQLDCTYEFWVDYLLSKKSG